MQGLIKSINFKSSYYSITQIFIFVQKIDSMYESNVWKMWDPKLGLRGKNNLELLPGSRIPQNKQTLRSEIPGLWLFSYWSRDQVTGLSLGESWDPYWASTGQRRVDIYQEIDM